MATEWTETQQNEVFDQVWRTRVAVCPIHSSPLDVEFPAQTGREELWARARCRQCGGGYVRSREDDHRRASFRDWTDEEKAELVRRYLAEEVPYCPVDGALIIPEQYATGTTTYKNTVRLKCERCGQVHNGSV